MPFTHPGKPRWTRPLKHKPKPPGHNLNVACATAQALYLSICRSKGSKKLLTLQLCSLVAVYHCVPCNCAWETAPSSIFSQDIPPNPQKAQPTGPGLKVHLHTNSVTYGRGVHEILQNKGAGLHQKKYCPTSPYSWNLAASSQQNGWGSEFESTFPLSSPVLTMKVKISGLL